MSSFLESGPQFTVLAVVPIILLLLTLIFVQIPGGFVDDPDYSELIGALNLLGLHPPGQAQMEHPGTPVQILGALILACFWLPPSTMCCCIPSSICIASMPASRS